MSQKKLIGLVLLIAGGVLLYFGWNASQAPLESIGESLTGKYSDETMAYLIGGAVAAVIGIVMLTKK